MVDHVYGGVPAVAARLCEYAEPTVPEGSGAVVIVGGTGAGSIVMVNA